MFPCIGLQPFSIDGYSRNKTGRSRCVDGAWTVDDKSVTITETETIRDTHDSCAFASNTYEHNGEISKSYLSTFTSTKNYAKKQ